MHKGKGKKCARTEVLNMNFYHLFIYLFIIIAGKASGECTFVCVGVR